ncbi:MAG TPA: lysylphosphatidylglycerol synthase transmembrane domain-containing protein [Nitrospira sp.]|nr:lysylphosphatidylglycerol synthase transmembrane domain-containing protein [Nitrospira sp.]
MRGLPSRGRRRFPGSRNEGRAGQSWREGTGSYRYFPFSVWRYLLLAVGVLTLGLLVWHIGPERIYEAAARFGPGALLVMLIPSLAMYVFEAYGWRLTLGSAADGIAFWKILAIRTAGEVVNMTTPTAYVGGEPLKAYLLQRHGIPLVEGLASVVIAKTIMTLAQVLFILIGITLAFWMLGSAGSSGQIAAAGLMTTALLFFGVAAFIFVQKRGLFMWTLQTLRRGRLHVAFLESREEKLRSLDEIILNFYTHHRSAFYASTGLYLLGWLAEAVEVYVILFFLGGPAEPLSAVSIGALSVFIKGGTFFIPGSLGAQDGGNLLLLKAFGYSDVAGITFALLRRFRELIWIGIGLICLAGIGKAQDRSRQELM